MTRSVPSRLSSLHSSLTSRPSPSKAEVKPSQGTPPILDLANFDKSGSPRKDVNQFVSGHWFKTHPIPADKSRFSAFDEVAERNREVVKTAIAELIAKKPTPSTAEGKFVRYYASGMNEAAIKEAGLRPLQPTLDAIGQISSAKSLVQAFGKLSLLGASMPMSLSGAADPKDSLQMIAHLSPGGKSLPERSYYVNNDERSLKVRKAFVAYVQTTLQSMGESAQDAAAHAEMILAMETRLAKASLSAEQQRDPQATYNKMSIAQLKKRAPGAPWAELFTGLGINAPSSVNVQEPAFAAEVAKMVADVPLADWKTYLRFHLVDSVASSLGKDFEQASFDFYEKTLMGVPEMPERSKRVQEHVAEAMGDVVGRLYVEKAFPPEAKAQVLEMVDNIKAAMAEHIRQLPWMSEQTKTAALEKLSKMEPLMGYPSQWDDYTDVEVSDSYAANTMSAHQRASRQNLEKIGKPVDRTQWFMTADTVNAYFSPETNQIVFPAGILQPPFFDPTADAAVNYGGIGSVIGHEITHAFDDQGSQYDGDGNLRDWWTPEDAKRYTERAARVIEQFDHLTLLGEKVNGKLTQGENIADLGGLAIAFDAYKKSIEGKPEPKPIDGFTDEQRFFLSHATHWRANIRDEAAKSRLRTDPHAPAVFRANQPLKNLDPFVEAFDVQPGDPMFLDDKDRAKIW